jgi:uncharacterized membrane protein
MYSLHYQDHLSHNSIIENVDQKTKLQSNFVTISCSTSLKVGAIVVNPPPYTNVISLIIMIYKRWCVTLCQIILCLYISSFIWANKIIGAIGALLATCLYISSALDWTEPYMSVVALASCKSCTLAYSQAKIQSTSTNLVLYAAKTELRGWNIGTHINTSTRCRKASTLWKTIGLTMPS